MARQCPVLAATGLRRLRGWPLARDASSLFRIREQANFAFTSFSFIPSIYGCMSTVVPIRTPKRRRVPSHPVVLAGCACVGGAMLTLILPTFQASINDTRPSPEVLAPRSAQPVRGERWRVDMPVCVGPVRSTCVVDGDTVWLAGEKMRLSSFNAPETEGACRTERDLAGRAQSRLSTLLSAGPFRVQRHGTDRYGRTLARIWVGRIDIGRIMVADGLAHHWRGHRQGWC